MRALLVTIALLVAGCAAPVVEPPTPGTDALPVPPPAAPRVDARATLDLVRSFSEAYPYRQSGAPDHLAAREAIAAVYEDAGLEVVRQRFDSTIEGRVPLDGQVQGENVIGIKWGADRESWVVVAAHYDILEGAVYGAYDDGSGTAMVLELAKAFADVGTHRTIAFIQFDQEERGTLGSEAFVQAVLADSFDHPVTLAAMVDLDMVGITYPHPAKLVGWQNSPALQARSEELRVALGFPDGHVEYREPKGGSSDGAVFIKAGVPTMYYFSDWDEYVLPHGEPMPNPGLPGPGGYVGAYPWWHKADTYETMVAAAGDEATLEQGFQNTLDVVSPLVLFAASAGFVPDAQPPG